MILQMFHAVFIIIQSFDYLSLYYKPLSFFYVSLEMCDQC